MVQEPMERRRKVVFPFHYSADKKLVWVVASLRNRPGALGEVLNALGPRVNLVGTTSYKSGTARAIFSGIGELLSDEYTPQMIEALLTPLDSVVSCQAWGSKDGLLVDWFHTGVESGLGEPYIMLPTAALAQTFQRMVKTFGTGGETILFLQGRDFGLARFEVYRKMLGGRASERIEEAQHIFEALGYGKAEVEVLEQGRVVRLSREDCFECAGQSHNGHGCAFSRGLASGIFEAIFGAENTCEEVACRLNGSERCEFLVTLKRDPAHGKD